MANKLTLDAVDDAQKALDYRVTGLERLLKVLLGGTGLTLVVVVGASYWLGSKLATVDETVKTSSEKTNKVYEAVWTDPNSLATRASLVENKLSATDKTLEKMDVKLDEIKKELEPRRYVTTMKLK